MNGRGKDRTETYDADHRSEAGPLRRTSSGAWLLPSCRFRFTSARENLFASLGFPALATTSAGMAFAAGLPDGCVTRADVLKHIGELAGAVDAPLNADFEAGFARDAEGVYESARARLLEWPAFRSRITPATATRRSTP